MAGLPCASCFYGSPSDGVRCGAGLRRAAAASRRCRCPPSGAVKPTMQTKPTPAELPDDWRALAAQQRRLGADSQARILEFCADELAAALLRAGDELLSLSRAAQESGYSADHLSRMVREGRIPNSGRKAKPLIRRKDLPVKASRYKENPCANSQNPLYSSRLFRDIIHSKFGGDDAQD